MKLEDLTTIGQLTDFLSGTQLVAFSVINKKDDCALWIQRELVRFRYLALQRPSKGVVIRYLMKVSAYARQQHTSDRSIPSGRPGATPPANRVRFQTKTHSDPARVVGGNGRAPQGEGASPRGSPGG